MGLYLYDDVDTKIDSKLIKTIYKATLKHFGLKDEFEIEIVITDENTIKNLNKEKRNIDSVTDVLSFPAVNFRFPFVKKDYAFYINPENNKVILGEIVLCEKRAKEQANEYGHSFDREVGFLILHGFLHLLGFDHIEKQDEVVMQKHAYEILESINLTRD